MERSLICRMGYAKKRGKCEAIYHQADNSLDNNLGVRFANRYAYTFQSYKHIQRQIGSTHYTLICEL